MKVNSGLNMHDRDGSEQKKLFEIAPFLNIERGTSRARNSNENNTTNKFISVATKCKIIL